MWDTDTRILYSLACLPDDYLAKKKHRFIEQYQHLLASQISREVLFALVGKTRFETISEAAQARLTELREVVSAERKRSATHR